MSYTNHIKAASDLVTQREATSAGFIQMALERSRRATPYIEEARVLKVAASSFLDVDALIADKTLQAALLTAAGVSNKATQYFQPDERENAVAEFARQYLQSPVESFPDELASRFLLTKGDTLGGSMRNVVGYLAEVRLLRALIAALRLRSFPFMWQHCESGAWHVGQQDTPDIERYAHALAWSGDKGSRVLLLNTQVPQIKKNVDLVLLAATHTDLNKSGKRRVLTDSGCYIAFGELKGGIDPAGADEHWKTAQSALNRISEKFNQPTLFFIAAAIVPTMSMEIWSDLQSGKLANAANLTKDEHVASIASWITGL